MNIQICMSIGYDIVNSSPSTVFRKSLPVVYTFRRCVCGSKGFFPTTLRESSTQGFFPFDNDNSFGKGIMGIKKILENNEIPRSGHR